MVFADPNSPVYMQPAFDLALTMLEGEALVQSAFRSGRGVGWSDQPQCLFCTTGKLSARAMSEPARRRGFRRWKGSSRSWEGRASR